MAYCRTSSHFDEVNAFYGILAHDVLMHMELGEVIIVGDFNARLGKFTGDKTLKGEWAVNKNASLFRSFLTATNLKLMNRKLAYGKPTFVRPSAKASSIIDFVLTTAELDSSITKFNMEVLNMGSYVAHNTGISFQHPTTLPHTPPPNNIPLFYYKKIDETNSK